MSTLPEPTPAQNTMIALAMNLTIERVITMGRFHDVELTQTEAFYWIEFHVNEVGDMELLAMKYSNLQALGAEIKKDKEDGFFDDLPAN